MPIAFASDFALVMNPLVVGAVTARGLEGGSQ